MDSLVSSFSIVLETENVSSIPVEQLMKAISSLEHQTLSPDQANEVLLIAESYIPPTQIEILTQRFPWLKIHFLRKSLRYYETKMLGAKLVTGDILVYFDSDSIYCETWLQRLLTPFAENPEIQVVGGQTVTDSTGIYGTALAMTYIFPLKPRPRASLKTGMYTMNNVAFRRSFLLDHPLPLDLPIFRGNCYIHNLMVIKSGYTIWQDTEATAIHPPPLTIDYFFWRHLLRGHDNYRIKALLSQYLEMIPWEPNNSGPYSGEDNRPKQNSSPSSSTQLGLLGKGLWKLGTIYSRAREMIKSDVAKAPEVILSLPITITTELLTTLGWLICYLNSDIILDLYLKINGYEPIPDRNDRPPESEETITLQGTQEPSQN